MGITGLLNFVKHAEESKSAIKKGHISQFRGKTAVVDAYAWLHKGVFTCAQDLFLKKETTRYVDYCLKYIKLLLSFDITPILVFDGGRMPFKVVEKQRREDRKSARQRANDLISIGKMHEANSLMVQAIDVTHEMASNLIKKCHEMGIDSIVAPFEADSQLAYMELANLADFIITEDSDLIIFGCSNIFFKLAADGSGEIYNKKYLDIALKNKSIHVNKFKFEKLRHAAILSGCDYVKNLPGIGLNKAWKFMNMTENPVILQFLKKLPSYLKLSVVVDDSYINDFIMAEYAFLYPIVYDPRSRKRVTLNNASDKCDDEYFIKYQSLFEKPECNELELAIGNIDMENRIYDNFKPENASFRSIFSLNPVKPEVESKRPTFFNYESYKSPAIKRKIENTNNNEEEKDLFQYYASMNIVKKEVLVDDDEPDPPKRIRKCMFVKEKMEKSNVDIENATKKPTVIKKRLSPYFLDEDEMTDDAKMVDDAKITDDTKMTDNSLTKDLEKLNELDSEVVENSVDEAQDQTASLVVENSVDEAQDQTASLNNMSSFLSEKNMDDESSPFKDDDSNSILSHESIVVTPDILFSCSSNSSSDSSLKEIDVNALSDNVNPLSGLNVSPVEEKRKAVVTPNMRLSNSSCNSSLKEIDVNAVSDAVNLAPKKKVMKVKGKKKAAIKKGQTSILSFFKKG